jgi:hypothetical protein
MQIKTPRNAILLLISINVKKKIEIFSDKTSRDMLIHIVNRIRAELREAKADIQASKLIYDCA